jgi:hypothetical protein
MLLRYHYTTSIEKLVGLPDDWHDLSNATTNALESQIKRSIASIRETASARLQLIRCCVVSNTTIAIKVCPD